MNYFTSDKKYFFMEVIHFTSSRKYFFPEVNHFTSDKKYFFMVVKNFTSSRKSLPVGSTSFISPPAAIVVATKLPRVGPIQVYRLRDGSTHILGTSCVRLIINHERAQHNDQVWFATQNAAVYIEMTWIKMVLRDMWMYKFPAYEWCNDNHEERRIFLNEKKSVFPFFLNKSILRVL